MLCPAVVGVCDVGDSLGVTNAETVFDPPPEIEIVISDVKAAIRFSHCIVNVTTVNMFITSMANGLQTNSEICLKSFRRKDSSQMLREEHS